MAHPADAEKKAFALMVHDRMLEEIYPGPVSALLGNVSAQIVQYLPQFKQTLVLHSPNCLRPPPSQVKSFKSDAKPAPVFSVPILEQGREALATMNTVSGLCDKGIRLGRC